MPESGVRSHHTWLIGHHMVFAALNQCAPSELLMASLRKPSHEMSQHSHNTSTSTVGSRKIAVPATYLQRACLHTQSFAVRPRMCVRSPRVQLFARVLCTPLSASHQHAHPYPHHQPCPVHITAPVWATSAPGVLWPTFERPTCTAGDPSQH